PDPHRTQEETMSCCSVNRNYLIRPSLRLALITILILVLTDGWHAIGKAHKPGWLLANLALEGQSAISTDGQNNEPETPMLEPNKPVKREIVGQQRHNYRINLDAGQYVRVEVDQQEVNVNLNLYDPDGKLAVIAVRDPKGPQKEILETVAEKAGIHRLA